MRCGFKDSKILTSPVRGSKAEMEGQKRGSERSGGSKGAKVWSIWPQHGRFHAKNDATSLAKGYCKMAVFGLKINVFS